MGRNTHEYTRANVFYIDTGCKSTFDLVKRVLFRFCLRLGHTYFIERLKGPLGPALIPQIGGIVLAC